MFDWVRFLSSTGVDHKIGPGSNVRREHVGIQCPGCGTDEKYHFSIRLTDGKIRGCWRDPAHWMSPKKLVALLAGVSEKEAGRILAEEDYPVDVTPNQILADLEKGEAAPWAPKALKWPAEAKPFSRSPGRSESAFQAYLGDRGFTDPAGVGEAYGLRWASTGDWKGRLLFPLRHGGKLVGWTGRAITKSRIRYKTHPAGEDAVVQNVVWNLEPTDYGRILLLTEGPFDGLKMDTNRVRAGDQAIALLGLSVGRKKHALLARAMEHFERLVILLDRGAEAQAMELKDALAILKPEIATVPPGVKDPGDLSTKDAESLWRSLIQ